MPEALPERGSAFCAFWRSTVQAAVPQSGNTAMATTRVRPSGLTRKVSTSSGRWVTCTAVSPARSVRQIWSEPERLEMK